MGVAGGQINMITGRREPDHIRKDLEEASKFAAKYRDWLTNFLIEYGRENTTTNAISEKLWTEYFEYFRHAVKVNHIRLEENDAYSFTDAGLKFIEEGMV